MSDNLIKVFVDGSIRANGKENAFGGVGVYCLYKDKPIIKLGKIVKSKTNNESEYLAIISALEVLKEYNAYELIIYSDSQLVVNQLSNKWVINKKELVHHYNTIHFAINKRSGKVKIEWIPREQNTEADALAQGITKGCMK